jgi:hypothetical protein
VVPREAPCISGGLEQELAEQSCFGQHPGATDGVDLAEEGLGR